MYLVVTCTLILGSILGVFIALKKKKGFGKPEVMFNGGIKVIPCSVSEECETAETIPIDQEPSSAAANGRSARKFSLK